MGNPMNDQIDSQCAICLTHFATSYATTEPLAFTQRYSLAPLCNEANVVVLTNAILPNKICSNCWDHFKSCTKLVETRLETKLYPEVKNLLANTSDLALIWRALFHIISLSQGTPTAQTAQGKDYCLAFENSLAWIAKKNSTPAKSKAMWEFQKARLDWINNQLNDEDASAICNLQSN